MTRRARPGIGVFHEADRLEPWRLGRIRPVAHSAGVARIRPWRGNGWIRRVRGEWTVAALTGNPCVGVCLSKVCDVSVALDAGQLAGIHDRSGLDVQKGACSVGAQTAVITRNEHPADSKEQNCPHCKQRAQPEQVLVGPERRHAGLRPICGDTRRSVMSDSGAPSISTV
jgi:hypothetical protein